MLASVRTPSGATCKGVLQLEATFIEVKNMYLQPRLEPGSSEVLIRKHPGKGV